MRAFSVARARCLRTATVASSASSRSSGVAGRSAHLRLGSPPPPPLLLLLQRRQLSSAFVSTHFQLEDPREIPEFMDRKSLVRRETDTHWIVRDCPFCHATKGKLDNLFKLYVHKAKGVYKCHRCGAQGSWFEFKQRLQPNVAISSSSLSSSSGFHLHSDARTGIEPVTKVISVLDNEKAMAIQRNLFEDAAFESVRSYLTDTRGLSERVLTKYGVGAIEQPFRGEDGEQVVAKCISFPWMARQADMDAMGVVRSDATLAASVDKNQFDVIRLKIRGVENKTHQRLVPKGGSWGLFGWNTVPLSADEIVLTEGEFDAMAVHQATGLPAVSLPNGCQSLPPNVLPLLERFKKIYLWLDNDTAGQSSVDKFASKLGIARCFIVRPPADAAVQVKDANEALLRGVDIAQLLQRAEIVPHSQIATFEQLRRDVYDAIVNPITACGVQSRTLPSLNRLLKGHRPGEVTILTGPTGCGKTTLLSQLSLDLCGQGVNTLWGSFEIKNTRLVQKMLTQLHGKSLASDLAAFERVADKFEAMPMYFLRFFGSTDVDEVLDAMEYAVYAYDVQHILLDNVQFMMAGQGRGFDKFERQDAALDKFRKFATQQNVHLTLVIHPRKEQEDVDLTLTSVFGTAKATQEADNVLILQRSRGENKLDVRKNRFDGTLGSIPLHFDPESNALRELGEHTMDESVASIHLEAEMQLQQKMERQKRERAAASATTSPPTPEPIPTRFVYTNERAEDSSRPPRYQYTEQEQVGREQDGEDGEELTHYTLQAVEAPYPNGAGGHHRVNGLNGLAKPSGTGPAMPMRSGPNGAGRAGPSTPGRDAGSPEPFSSFTPIITR